MSKWPKEALVFLYAAPNAPEFFVASGFMKRPNGAPGMEGAWEDSIFLGRAWIYEEDLSTSCAVPLTPAAREFLRIAKAQR